MELIRTAVLGCGSFAHKHAGLLAMLKNEIELVAFCDRNEPKARAFSEQYTAGNATVFTDHHSLLNQAGLDLLVNCLPPYGHSDEVELAAERGVHLLIEKPIALTPEHAWRMVKAVEKTGIKTQVGFMFRFGKAVEQLKSLMTSDATGPVGLMSARYFCNSLHASWWRVREKSGGQLVEQVIHMVDLMRHLMGEPVSVFSRQGNMFHRHIPDYTVEDISATLFTFASGALGVIYATNGAIPNRWINEYHVVAQRITADFTDANHATFHFTGIPDCPSQTIASDENVYLRQLRDLLEAIRFGGETRTPLREGARSLDLALAATRSMETRTEVQLGG